MQDLTLNQPVIIVHSLDNTLRGKITKIDGEFVEITDNKNQVHPFNINSNRRNWKSYNIHFRTDIEQFEREQNDLSVRFGEDEYMVKPVSNQVTTVQISYPHDRYMDAFQPDAFGQDNI